MKCGINCTHFVRHTRSVPDSTIVLAILSCCPTLIVGIIFIFCLMYTKYLNCNNQLTCTSLIWLLAYCFRCWQQTRTHRSCFWLFWGNHTRPAATKWNYINYCGIIRTEVKKQLIQSYILKPDSWHSTEWKKMVNFSVEMVWFSSFFSLFLIQSFIILSNYYKHNKKYLFLISHPGGFCLSNVDVKAPFRSNFCHFV